MPDRSMLTRLWPYGLGGRDTAEGGRYGSWSAKPETTAWLQNHAQAATVSHRANALLHVHRAKEGTGELLMKCHYPWRFGHRPERKRSSRSLAPQPPACLSLQPPKQSPSSNPSNRHSHQRSGPHLILDWQGGYQHVSSPSHCFQLLLLRSSGGRIPPLLQPPFYLLIRGHPGSHRQVYTRRSEL